MALVTTTKENNKTISNDTTTWNQDDWENFNNEIEFCEQHIVLPNIPEYQVKQKAIEIFKSFNLPFKINNSFPNFHIVNEIKELVERKLLHWIGNQIDNVNTELKRDYNKYDGYKCLCAQCCCNYNFMLDNEFDFIKFIVDKSKELSNIITEQNSGE